jgi:hypothetical protein
MHLLTQMVHLTRAYDLLISWDRLRLIIEGAFLTLHSTFVECYY